MTTSTTAKNANGMEETAVEMTWPQTTALFVNVWIQTLMRLVKTTGARDGVEGLKGKEGATRAI